MQYILFFFIALVQLVQAQSTVESIPNQKLIDGSYVSNPDHILDASTVSQLDSLLQKLEKNTTVQVAVVVVGSIGDNDIFEFAQELFIKWGIGNKEKNNGLLILFVNDQRTIRFHTGDGIEGVLPDVVCKRIQRDYMVPAFKNGDYNGGMLAGIQQVAKILTDPSYAKEVSAPEDEVSDWVGFVIFLGIFGVPLLITLYVIKASNGRFSNSKRREDTSYPEMPLTRWLWLLEFVVVPVVIVTLFGISNTENPIGNCVLSLYLYYMFTLFHRLYRERKVIKQFLKTQDYYEIVEFLRKQQWYWFFMGILFPLPFAFYFIYHLFSKRLYRNYPRQCKLCNHKMKKLNDKDEDEYLSAEQQMEEKLRSVDYDVWKCVSCAAVDFWFYLGRNSKYETCPKCKTLAFYAVSNRTITSASYTSSGKGEEVYACKFCKYERRKAYTIAKLEHISSSSSSGSFDSSSSSSGGSWGGGSSSGGGASSSW